MEVDDLIVKIQDFRVLELKQFLSFAKEYGAWKLKRAELLVACEAVLRRNIDDVEFRVKVLCLHRSRFGNPCNEDDIRAEVLNHLVPATDVAPAAPVEPLLRSPLRPIGQPTAVTVVPPLRSPLRQVQLPAAAAVEPPPKSPLRQVQQPAAAAVEPPLIIQETAADLERNISVLDIGDDDDDDYTADIVDASVETNATTASMDLGYDSTINNSGSISRLSMSSPSPSSSRGDGSACHNRLIAILDHSDVGDASGRFGRSAQLSWPTFFARPIKDLPNFKFLSTIVQPRPMLFFGGCFSGTHVLLLRSKKDELLQDDHELIVRILNPKTLADELPSRGANIDPELTLVVKSRFAVETPIVVTNIGSKDYPIRIKRLLPHPNLWGTIADDIKISVTGYYNQFLCKEPLLVTASIVKEISEETLFDDLLKSAVLPKKTTLEMIHKKFTPESDDDVAVTRLEISLKCPLSCRRIEVPAKGLDCQHMDCFDCRTYLQLHVCSQAWVCPICRKVTPYEKLVIDKFMCQVLLDARPAITDIRLYADGTWKSATDRKSLAPAAIQRTALVVTNFDDLDDVDASTSAHNETINLDETVDDIALSATMPGSDVNSKSGCVIAGSRPMFINSGESDDETGPRPFHQRVVHTPPRTSRAPLSSVQLPNSSCVPSWNNGLPNINAVPFNLRLPGGLISSSPFVRLSSSSSSSGSSASTTARRSSTPPPVRAARFGTINPSGNNSNNNNNNHGGPIRPNRHQYGNNRPAIVRHRHNATSTDIGLGGSGNGNGNGRWTRPPGRDNNNRYNNNYSNNFNNNNNNNNNSWDRFRGNSGGRGWAGWGSNVGRQYQNNGTAAFGPAAYTHVQNERLPSYW